MELMHLAARRDLVRAIIAAALSGCALAPVALSQSGAGPTRQVSPRQVFEAGYRLASFNAQAAEIALRKDDPRPQVKEFAIRMRASRGSLQEHLRTIGMQRGWPLPVDLPEQV